MIFFAVASEHLFQSSPVTKDGRYANEQGISVHITRFNPRPSLRTGATRIRDVSDAET